MFVKVCRVDKPELLSMIINNTYIKVQENAHTQIHVKEDNVKLYLTTPTHTAYF